MGMESMSAEYIEQRKSLAELYLKQMKLHFNFSEDTFEIFKIPVFSARLYENVGEFEKKLLLSELSEIISLRKKNM